MGRERGNPTLPRPDQCIPCSQRSTSRDDRDSEDGDQPSPVIPVDPDACILPDAALCAFTVLDSVLVTLVQGPARWKMQLFEQPCPGEDPRPGVAPGAAGAAQVAVRAVRPEGPLLPVAGPPGQEQVRAGPRPPSRTLLLPPDCFRASSRTSSLLGTRAATSSEPWPPSPPISGAPAPSTLAASILLTVLS